ncbi:MAG: 3-oxo-tetronate kinase [Alphaproteobacteria bacterium]
MELVVIADDFTGATDIASFLVEAGLDTIQINKIPSQNTIIDAKAVVISLKSRSCPKNQAITESLEALEWAKAQNCKRIFFKYCSTFDSTTEGNIGPVTDALMMAMGESTTVICPALPVNGRSVYKGYLFVNDQLLNESPMKNHPITPMADASLLRLMAQQSVGKVGLIDMNIIAQGAMAVKKEIQNLKSQNINYIVFDAIAMADLDIIAQASLDEFNLLTGASGLGGALAKYLVSPAHTAEDANLSGQPQNAPTIILAGSCSAMTQKQVQAYQNLAPSYQIDIEKCLFDDEYVQKLANWYNNHNMGNFAPMIYATTNVVHLKQIQQKYGAKRASDAVEQLFYNLAIRLKDMGVKNFIVAGGETSGSVTQALNINAFYIGPQIAPGVPWVRGLDNPLSLALKSGNFGDENFFEHAQIFINKK